MVKSQSKPVPDKPQSASAHIPSPPTSAQLGEVTQPSVSDLFSRGAEVPQGKRSLRLHVAFWLAIGAIALMISCVQVDRDGVIASRERHIEAIGDQRVEIKGNCFSSCTLQLGARNVCIHRSALLGFHGPSASGQPLTPAEFERWSKRMAAYYREPLRSKFLSQWRHDIDRLHRVSGAEIIALGYQECGA